MGLCSVWMSRETRQTDPKSARGWQQVLKEGIAALHARALPGSCML